MTTRTRTGHFSKELFIFLRQLERNNDRAWFEKNRSRYIEHCRNAMLEFIEDIGPYLWAISKRLIADPRPVGGSNELWLGLSGVTPDVDGVVMALDDDGVRVRKTYLASDMVLERVEQPLVNAGWGALLVLMFLALVLASASGVMLFSFIDTRERQTEFALLRTLGSSRRQLNGAVWFSLLLVAICGIALGTLASQMLLGNLGGQLIGISLLPLMEVAEEGVRVTPPMVLQINWVTLGVSYLILGSVTAGTVLWLIWFTAKMEVQQVLRIGEG